MTQLPLLGYSAPSAGPKASEQTRQIVRVATGIAEHVLEFCRRHEFFLAEELRRYVGERTGRAPSSPDRILRDLRAKGFLTYTVERQASRYTVTWVAP